MFSRLDHQTSHVSDVYVIILMCLQFSQIEGVLENFYGTKTKIQCVHPKVHDQDENIHYSLPAIYNDTLISVSTECWHPGSGADWDLFQPWLHPPGLWETGNCGNTVKEGVEPAPVHGQTIRVQCVWPWRARVLPTSLITPLNSKTNVPRSSSLHTLQLLSSHLHVQCHTLQSISRLTAGSIFNHYQSSLNSYQSLIQTLWTPKWNWNLTNPVLILFFSKILHFYMTSHDCLRTQCVTMSSGQVTMDCVCLHYTHGASQLVCGCCSDRNYIIIDQCWPLSYLWFNMVLWSLLLSCLSFGN